ncbi:FtsJ RNA 2'-O-methyltransferase 3 [Rhinolophus ferrumequinum]|uniref:pre-rRNA processing protein FTSJ3 n=1 Tax=Rhinolophus ferrumequinum TaxID=59479 RepID=A0A671EYP8_RHIFE|nr:pre-rRNA 2'-O-ribose RNA methyltransferase FTSJ3 [Rhinolophus ferrumequinum]XP_032946403.1 pre-rRNA 2'-O-ribose RNA methyltransferase FTSJ3 [Rhinolophus ferrumequinum]KAF6298579.1 FtsJ RNA 2'-O-methyltransferase 3 [Rhinolophus ferrumequinum]
MGKKGKVGKSRRDKFYHLAKETGYRSRSAFKLIQLNRRFQFLQKARALLDLCAAPGGWLQVAAKFMPVSSLIVGVDLVPIKPLPNVVTLQEDITTEHCRQALRKELKTWKVDVVLNDGAPNVGASWVHDAYSQAHLTLMALRLACDFLARGGCFITKVFRSRDYQPLLWIFQQLFRRVQATKPQASRHESAEIFVVCQGFLAPDKVDNKFFDPKFAFKEVEVQAKTVTELVTKKKPKAEGYAEGDLTLYHRTSVTDFLRAANPVDFLSKASEISLDDEELAHHPATTEDIRVCCQDIKVLGRKELRSLLNWRTKLRRFVAKRLKEQAKALDISLSSGEEEEEGEESTAGAVRQPSKEEEEEEELNRTLAEMKAQEVAELKRKKKKLLREQRKQRERVELKMDLPGVSIADEGETGMFSLRTIRGHQLLEEVTQGDMSAADTFTSDLPRDDIYISDVEDDDDASLDSDLDPEELAGVGGPQSLKDPKRVRFAEADDKEEEEEENPLLVRLEEKAVLQEEQANLWFSKDGFRGIEDDADEALEISQAQLLYESRRKGQPQPSPPTPSPPSSVKTERKPPQCQEEAPKEEEAPLETEGATSPGGQERDDSSDSDSSSEDGESWEPHRGKKRSRGPKSDDDGFEIVPIEDPVKHRILDPEGLALGAIIASSKKAKRDLIDNSFNRYTFNEDEGELPEWFVQEEKQHRIRQLPIDKKEVEHYRKRWREINARPIKKVAEAKARKKRRMLKKLEQTKKKAEAVVNTVDISEREKVAQLRSLYKKAGLGKEKRQVTYVVAKKGVGRKVRRPAGVRGHFKVVDSRMKKDQRAQQRKEQKKKNKRK